MIRYRFLPTLLSQLYFTEFTDISHGSTGALLGYNGKASVKKTLKRVNCMVLDWRYPLSFFLPFSGVSPSYFMSSFYPHDSLDGGSSCDLSPPPSPLVFSSSSSFLHPDFISKSTPCSFGRCEMKTCTFKFHFLVAQHPNDLIGCSLSLFSTGPTAIYWLFIIDSNFYFSFFKTIFPPKKIVGTWLPSRLGSFRWILFFLRDEENKKKLGKKEKSGTPPSLFRKVSLYLFCLSLFFFSFSFIHFHSTFPFAFGHWFFIRTRRGTWCPTWTPHATDLCGAFFSVKRRKNLHPTPPPPTSLQK